MSDVRLAWALDGRGDVVFASSMVGVDPRDRPRVTCPECDDVVTLKAGERGIVSPHVAHRSGAACAATAPETAAHLNAKMRLVRELSARGALRLRSECRMGHHVAGDWHAPAWARAVPELKVDARRPDVALLDEGGAVVGAGAGRRARRSPAGAKRDAPRRLRREGRPLREDAGDAPWMK